ncbi:YybH family protein [Pelagibaculum spongiae]|nr:DUF4440 domain-containing protein [Pelagibaculum spongiae]
MKFQKKLFFAIGGFALITACASNQSKDLYQAIDKGNKATASAILNGNADLIADTYTDDGYVLSPDTPTIQGKSDVKQFWTDVINSGIEDVKIETGEVYSSGDLAYAVGTLAVTPKNGKEGFSRYVLVFKKVAGDWKLHIDIWTPSA